LNIQSAGNSVAGKFHRPTNHKQNLREELKMKTAEKKASTATSTARGRILAWPGIALLSLALACAVATAFPVNFKQDKNAQGNNVEPSKRFVGTWKGKAEPDAILEHVLIFKIEDGRLKGTQREWGIRQEAGGEPKIIRDEYVTLPDLDVEGRTISWKRKWNLPDHEALTQVTLMSDDEILVETVGGRRSTGQPTLIIPISFKLKREK
jgi:hypothetical protein